MVKRHFIIFVLTLAVIGLFSSCSRLNMPSNSAAHSASTVHPTNSVDLKAVILKESQPGGKLDFFTPIKGHEFEGRLIEPGVYGNGLEFSLYSWGRSVKEMGVKTLEEAYAIYSEFKGQPAGSRDKETIQWGFMKGKN